MKKTGIKFFASLIILSLVLTGCSSQDSQSYGNVNSRSTDSANSNARGNTVSVPNDTNTDSSYSNSNSVNSIPTPVAPNGTYRNVDNNVVPSPYRAPSAPAGASAICGDGTYSFSQHRQGTCSHHGGVEEWLY